MVCPHWRRTTRAESQLIWKSAEAFAVLMKYDSALGQSLPLILANDAAAFRRQRALRRFGTAMMVLTATAVGTAAMAVEDPMAPLAAVSASFIDVAASMSNQPIFRTAAAAPSSLSADNEGPRIATAAAAEPAYRNQAEMAAGPPGALLNQFVAWSQDKQQQELIEAQARQQPAAEPATLAATAQDAPTMAEASEPLRVTPTPQNADSHIRNARAELPSTRPDRAAPLHAAHAPAKPAERAQAQDALAHGARPQSLLQMLGWRG
jgi:hypothetical protein